RLRTHPQSSFDPSPVHPSPPSSLTPTRPPPTSPLFPYTTLFRSHPPLPTSNDRGRRDVDGLAAPGAGHQRRCDRREDLTRLLHRSEEHTSELQSRFDLVCRLLLEKKKTRPLRRLHATRRALPASA